jgi:predicted Zn-dependent peptidase
MIEVGNAVDVLEAILCNRGWIEPEEHIPVYQKTWLENGIRVVTETLPEMRSVAIGILVDAGPRDESSEQMGLAHLTEHLIFQGTSNRNAEQIARLMDVGGGNMGAFTTRDYTCFFATVLDEYRTYALDLLGDVLLNSIFPSESVEREKRAILCEMDAARDMPFERVHSLLKSIAWRDHPLGNPIIGLPDTVKNLTREDVIYFSHKHYSPDRMIIAAAGNIEHQDFVAQVRDAFWRMLGQRTTTACTPPKCQTGSVVECMSVSQAYFSIGLPVYSYAHPDRYALHVLNNVLGGGSSSRLFQRIRDELGLVYNIGSEYHAYKDAGMLIIEGCTVPTQLLNVLDHVLIELRNLITKDEPIGEEELWKARMQIRGQHIIASENTSTRVSRLVTQEFYFGRHIPADEILDQIETVSDQALQSLIDEALANAFDQISVAVVGPEALDHYSALKVENLLAGFQKSG